MRFSSRFLLGFVLSLVGVRAATAQQAPTVVIVVRHADKDTIPKADPPLTAAGVVRAKALGRRSRRRRGTGDHHHGAASIARDGSATGRSAAADHDNRASRGGHRAACAGSRRGRAQTAGQDSARRGSWRDRRSDHPRARRSGHSRGVRVRVFESLYSRARRERQGGADDSLIVRRTISGARVAVHDALSRTKPR